MSPPSRLAFLTNEPVFSCNWRKLTCFMCLIVTQGLDLREPAAKQEKQE